MFEKNFDKLLYNKEEPVLNSKLTLSTEKRGKEVVWCEEKKQIL